ncbi:MAG: aminodeoxychorismate/anthranilate synthase component II [Pirellulales bacterium]|nr:aminodeoxychorismate/anthranilate synthase component II [Pirellulales bacterium]
MILLIDNYDSFTYNLVQRLGEIDPAIDLRVVRNDQLTVEDAVALAPTHLIISPGPCTPTEAGISVPLIERLAGKLPILGVCLGHQSIGQATGGKIVRAPRLMHGKVDQIHHNGRGLFAGLPNPLSATRYHSLVIEPETLHPDFEITAWSDLPDRRQREIMAIQHRQFPLFGLQFHPESFLTPQGTDMLRNFLNYSPLATRLAKNNPGQTLGRGFHEPPVAGAPHGTHQPYAHDLPVLTLARELSHPED